jgi:hypothetical protein
LNQLPKSPHGLTTTTKAQTTTILEESALQTLHYFGYFEHALRVEEVHKYLNVKASLAAVETALNRLLKKGRLSCNEGLWALDAAHCSMVGIARLCPTSGTRTPFNQDFGAGLILRPFLQNVYYKRRISISTGPFFICTSITSSLSVFKECRN